MANKIEFATALDGRIWAATVPVDPRELPTAQQKGERVVSTAGRPFVVHFTKAPIRNWQRRLARMFESLPKAEPDAAVRLELVFCYAFPKAVPLSKRLDFAPRTTRPDCDNLAKGLVDAMAEAGLFADDSQVADLRVAKVHTTGAPRIIITAEYGVREICTSQNGEASK